MPATDKPTLKAKKCPARCPRPASGEKTKEKIEKEPEVLPTVQDNAAEPETTEDVDAPLSEATLASEGGKDEAVTEAPPTEEPVTEELLTPEDVEEPVEEPVPEELPAPKEVEEPATEESVEPEVVKDEAGAEAPLSDDKVGTSKEEEEELGADLVPQTQHVVKRENTPQEEDDRRRLEEASERVSRLSADVADIKKEFQNIIKEREERKAARKAKQAKTPEADAEFTINILRKDGEDGLVIGWSVPPGSKITAFEILIDGHKQDIKTEPGKENTAVISSINLSKECTITMHVLENGRRSSTASAKYTPPS